MQSKKKAVVEGSQDFVNTNEMVIDGKAHRLLKKNQERCEQGH